MSVRWDAVVDRSAVRAADSRIAAPCVHGHSHSQGAAGIQACVQLFGAWPSLRGERRIQLELPPIATIADAIAALATRFGNAFLVQVLDRAGNKHRHCRLFVDGYPVEDINTRMAATAEPTQIEIILLIAPEGG